MLILIDESGCAGFKLGSSSHFVVGMIIFDNFQNAEASANIILNLKKEIRYAREFHFSSCKNDRRDQFFEAIKKAKFKIHLFVVEKRLIYREALKKNDELFANYCMKCLMKSGAHHFKNAVVKIDGKGSQAFKKGCASYLRKEMPTGAIKDIKFCNSETDILIQLADMIVSAYARPYNNPTKPDAYRWRNMIESKIENVWNFK